MTWFEAIFMPEANFKVKFGFKLCLPGFIGQNGVLDNGFADTFSACHTKKCYGKYISAVCAHIYLK